MTVFIFGLYIIYIISEFNLLDNTLTSPGSIIQDNYEVDIYKKRKMSKMY